MANADLKAQIVAKLNLLKGWGKCCNQIQDAADKALTDNQWNAYIQRAGRDLEECEGSDFLIINGQCWDWKEFDHKTGEIVFAYLDYFSEPELKRILKYL